MRLFGNLRELVRIFWREDGQEISLDANSATTYTADRNAMLPPGDQDSVLVGETNTQALQNKTIDGDLNTVTDLPVTALKTVLGDANEVIARDASGVPVSKLIENANIDPAAAIDATKIADGSVSNAEFQQLNGLTGNITTDSNTQTFTNKSIDGDTNTVTDLPIGAIKTEAGDANEVLRRDGSGVAVSGPNTIPNNSPLLTTDSTSVITNKDIDGGVASNTRRITFPSDTKANLDALTRKLGTVVVATDLLQAFLDNGSILVPIGSGSGSGETNYILNPSADTDLTGWVASGAGITVSRTTTAANLPREPLHDAAILITPVSGTTDYVRYRFTMGDADKGKLLKLQMAMKALSGYVAGDLVAEMWTNSASNYGGSYTQLTVANPNIPAGESVFLTTFASTTADYYELRIRRAAGTTAIALVDVLVGPGQLASVPAVSLVSESSASFPIGATVTPPTPASDALFYTRVNRVGSEAIIRYEFRQTLTDGAAGSGDYLLPIPSGLTVAASQIQQVGDDFSTRNVGYGSIEDAIIVPELTSDLSAFRVRLINATTNIFWGTAAVALNGPVTLSVTVRVPIAEWSDNVFSADSAVEYAFNTDLSDASDTTSFGYGQGGSQFGNFTAARSKRVRFRSPILPTDRIVLQVSYDAGVTWTDVAGSGNIDVSTSQNAVTYGAGLTAVNGTDVDVSFGQYRRADGATFGAAGSGWGDIDNLPANVWRVVKSSNPLAIGHDLVGQNKAGLVQSAGQLQGTNTDDTAEAGKVGERLESLVLVGSAVSLPSGSIVNITSIELTPGDWDVGAFGVVAGALPGGTPGFEVGVSFANNTMGTYGDRTASVNTANSLGTATGVVLPKQISVNVNTTIYLNIQAFHVAGTPTGYGRITARRMR